MANRQIVQLDPLVGADEESLFVMQLAGGGTDSTGSVPAGEARRLAQAARAPFPTLADLQADTKVESGDYVQWIGRGAAGDGGGNFGEIGTFGTADGDVVIDLPGSGLQVRSLFPAGFVSSLQYGSPSELFDVFQKASDEGFPAIDENQIFAANESKSKLTDLLLASVDVKGLYITEGASSTFSIGVCFGGDQNNVVEYNFRPDITGLWLVNGCRSGFTETFNVSGNYTPALVGDFTLSTGSTSGYTTTVGDKLIFSFDGPSLEVRFPSDERGGVWRFWIDGVATDISTFTPSASITTVVEEVASGLNVDQTHTGFAEFIGDDPANPPVGGTSRGWVYFRDTSTGTEYPTAARALQSKRGDSVGQLNTAATTWNLINPGGVNEFAMLLRKAGSAEPLSWVPSHNNEMILDSVETSVIIDGREIDPENVTETRTINKFVMEQTGLFRQLNEPEQLGRLTMRHSIDGSGKVCFGYRIELFEDIEVTTWYPVQYQVGKLDMTKLVLSNGAEIDLTVLAADESIPLFYRDVTSAAFLGEGSAGRYQGSAIDVDTRDAYQLKRKGLNIPDGSHLLNSRDAQDDYKLYWRANRTNAFLLEAGETIRMYCEWAAVSGVLQPNRLGALNGSSLL